MSLAHRIIPVILYRGRQAVKGIGFKSWRSIGHVEQQVRVYEERGVDELILLDIAATPSGRGPDFDLVADLTSKLFCPVTVGGGVRNVADARDLLRCGADKVAVCTSFGIIPGLAEKLGSQAIVASVDYRDDVGTFTHCGTQLCSGNRVYVMQACVKCAGEILYTNINRDGALSGYDLESIHSLAEAFDVPIIANGGCGTPEHMLQAIKAGASAVAASAMFAWTDTTPKQCAEYLKANNVEVRC